jgi:hypothetical protein
LCESGLRSPVKTGWQLRIAVRVVFELNVIALQNVISVIVLEYALGL